ncbi:MAG: rhodanese-like domain-containing protein [Bacteroidota bacterium]
MGSYSVRLTILYVVLSFGVTAQSTLPTPIQSKPYAAMLSTLLNRDVDEISVTELYELKERPVLLDAREHEEYSVSHLPGARYVGYDDFDLETIADLEYDTRIVVYCSVGYRSEKITQRLRENGYRHVSNLYGGLFEWMNRGYAVVDSEGKTTDRVHAFDRIWGIWLKRGQKVY